MSALRFSGSCSNSEHLRRLLSYLGCRHARPAALDEDAAVARPGSRLTRTPPSHGPPSRLTRTPPSHGRRRRGRPRARAAAAARAATPAPRRQRATRRARRTRGDGLVAEQQIEAALDRAAGPSGVGVAAAARVRARRPFASSRPGAGSVARRGKRLERCRRRARRARERGGGERLGCARARPHVVLGRGARGARDRRGRALDRERRVAQPRAEARHERLGDEHAARGRRRRGRRRV